MQKNNQEKGNAVAILQILYVSSNAEHPEQRQSQLVSILAQARVRNAKEHLTGCLACWGDWFVQVLEGAPETVDAMMARIARDTRHTDVTVRMRREVRNRSFPDWRMAAVDLESGVFPDAMLLDPKSLSGPALVLPTVLLLALMQLAESGQAA
jgi:Sensors of blue-light using FAD